MGRTGANAAVDRSHGIPFGLIIGGLIIGFIAAVVIGVNLYGARNPDYACLFVEHDWGAFGIDTSVPGGTEGDWLWWPVGLSCSFPLAEGGLIWLGPDPTLSIVLVAGLVGVAAAVAGVIVLASSRRRAIE